MTTSSGLILLLVRLPFHGIPMDLSAFIHVADPTKVKVAERERVEEEARLLDSTVGRVVLLLPVTLARAESDLEESINRLFDEGGSANQGDSTAGGGQDAKTELVMGVKIIATKNMITERPKRPRKKRQAVTDASCSSHPPKKLIGDHRTSSGDATSSKSPSVLKELLASSILNVEASVEVVATLPLVTFSVSVTPEHESGALADSITGLNLRIIDSSKRFVAPPLVMTGAVITTNIASIPTGPAPKISTKVISLVYASMFHDSDSTRTWNVSNETLLDNHDVSQEFIDHLAPPVLFSQICEMDYHHLFTEFNVGTARQACLNAEVRMRTKDYLSERKRLESECEKQADFLKDIDVEVENLKAQLLLKETEAAETACLRAQVFAAKATEKILTDEIDALKQRNDLEVKDLNVVVSSLRSQNDGLVDQVHALETTCSSLRGQVSGYERLKEQIEEFQVAQMNMINDNVAKLDVDLLEMALHLEEKFYPHPFNTISGRRWLLTRNIKLDVVKCLNLPEYLIALGSAISRAIEKGVQDGLSADIDYGKAGRSLTDIVAYTPATEADYNSALQRLREVDFPLLVELNSHKDASTVDIMDFLRLEGPLADAPRMNDLQPDVEQLTLPIHRPEDQVFLGETSLSFALSVAYSRVEKIRENVVAQRSALIDVWVPLFDALFAKNLIGAASTTGSVPTVVVTTTALSTTFASASSIPPITMDDYDIVNVDGQEDVRGDVSSFPTLEFKKEELDTTPERDLSN
ncbi:hypothetical protein Tco_0757515 [Tanacetum coccineum]